jgi:hypothetical protein
MLGPLDNQLVLGQEEAVNNCELGRSKWRKEQGGAVQGGLVDGGSGGQGRERVRLGVGLDCDSSRKGQKPALEAECTMQK